MIEMLLRLRFWLHSIQTQRGKYTMFLTAISMLSKKLSLQSARPLGRNPPRFSVPVGPARFMVGLMEDTFRLVGRKSHIRRDTIEKYTEDIAVDSSLIQKELGFVPQYDLKTGWEETIREMPR
jgi:nucleoside-diphosphate-sugar epimerase